MGCWGGLIVEVLFVATGGGVVVKGVCGVGNLLSEVGLRDSH